MGDLVGKRFARTMAMLALAAVTVLGLAGTARAASPNLSLNPQLFDFGVVGVGSQSGAADFTLRNLSSANSPIGVVSLVGSAPENFTIAADGCGSQVMRPSENCTVSVRFRPERAGNHLATLQIDVGSGQTRQSYMLGTARSLTGQLPPGAVKPSAACVKTKRGLALVRKKVRQTKRKLRGAKTKSRRQAIRKRLARQQREVRRLKALVAKRCDQATA